MAEILQFPEGVYPRSNQFWIISNSKDFVSPFNGSSQTVSFPGARWGCSMEFANLTSYQARQLEILIAQMKAGAKWVRLRDFAVYPRPVLGALTLKTPVNSVSLLLLAAGRLTELFCAWGIMSR